MSQAGILDITSFDPRDPLKLSGDTGFADFVANNVNVYGDSGATTSGDSIDTLTIYAPKYSSQNSGVTLEKNTGTFCATSGTYTLPASAGLTDGDLVAISCMVAAPGTIVIQAVGAQRVYVGNIVTSVAGTATSTDIGDTLMLRYRAATGFWYTTSIIGNWMLA